MERMTPAVHRALKSGSGFSVMCKVWEGPLRGAMELRDTGAFQLLSEGALGRSHDPHGPTSPRGTSHHGLVPGWP